jgi:anti-sigma regulatory factor (Ser/Thr protein kinase)
MRSPRRIEEVDMRGFETARPGEVTIATSAEMLQELFAQLRPVLAPAEREGYDTSRVYLLLDELLSNVHRHGYEGGDGLPIGVRVRVQDDRVHIVVRDAAKTFDAARHAVTRKAPPPDRATGGMGLFIVQSMCESFVHRVPQEGGNAVYLVMRMPRRGTDKQETRDRRAVGQTAGD